VTTRARVVADSALVGEGLRGIIGGGATLQVVEPGRRCPQAGYRGCPSGVLVLAVSGWDHALALLEQAVRRERGPVLVLLPEAEVERVGQLLVRGATGVLGLAQAPSCLSWAVPAVASGAPVLPPELGPRFVDTYLRPVRARVRASAARDRLARLSPREMDVLRQVARGRTNPDVAENLSLSVHTVKDHLRSISRKTSEGSRVGLARLAWEAELQGARAEGAGAGRR
jgi:DNA-binding NarL/FixJ family response regulator